MISKQLMWVTYGRNVPMPLPLCQGLSKVSRPVSRESKPVSKTVMTGSSSTTPTVGTGEPDEPASFKFAKFQCFAHEESWSWSHATYIISSHVFLQIFGHFLDPSWWKASLRCQRHPTGSPAARWCLHGLRWTATLVQRWCLRHMCFRSQMRTKKLVQLCP